MSTTGRRPVVDEIAKARLSLEEGASLDELKARVARGEQLPKDVLWLRAHKLYELRFFGDRRSFRLLFAKRGEGTLVLVALVFAEKKAQKLKASDFAKARKRLAQWDAINAVQ